MCDDTAAEYLATAENVKRTIQCFHKISPRMVIALSTGEGSEGFCSPCKREVNGCHWLQEQGESLTEVRAQAERNAGRMKA